MIVSALSMGEGGRPTDDELPHIYIHSALERYTYTEDNSTFLSQRYHFGSTGFDQILEAFHGFSEDGNLGQRTFIVRTLGALYLILSGAVFFRFSHNRLQLMHGANLKGDKR